MEQQLFIYPGAFYSRGHQDICRIVVRRAITIVIRQEMGGLVSQGDKKRICVLNNGKIYRIVSDDSGMLINEVCTGGLGPFPPSHKKDIQVGILIPQSGKIV